MPSAPSTTRQEFRKLTPIHRRIIYTRTLKAEWRVRSPSPAYLARFSLRFALRFSPLNRSPIFGSDVDLVAVACTVDTPGGTPVANLKAEDFRLLDNGEPREIRNFWQESDLPLTVALVADVSSSQAGYIRSHREAIAQFLRQVIGPRDRAMVVEVAQQSWLISDLTGSGNDLNAAVQRIGTPEGKRAPMLGSACRNNSFPHTCGGTALWHGLYYTAKQLGPVTGRKATRGALRWYGHRQRYRPERPDRDRASLRRCRLRDQIREPDAVRFDRRGNRPGGEPRARSPFPRDWRAGFPNPGRRTADVFSKIESDLRNMYILGFIPADVRDRKFHKLQVITERKDLIVRARAGYWGRPPE